jgi:predicted enzyme related to lactoylglutathione lyase
MMSRHLGARRRLKWGLVPLCAIAAITRLITGTTVAADAPQTNAIHFELPPLVQPASSEHHPGKVIWTDLVTSDLAGAKRFYGDLFGWTFTDIHIGDSDYSVALHDGEPMGGLLQRPVRPGEQRQPAWLTFISVRDVAAAERATVALGGKVLSKPHSYPRRGRQAVFADPQGAVFAVLQSSSGDPADELADPGEWIWSSLVTRDPGKGAAFYQTVFGYEAFDFSSDDGQEHVLLATNDYARATSNALPAGTTTAHPHWLNFVRVVSTPDAVAKAQALGGRVLVEPHPDRHGGLVAVVADPAGAAFGLLEWTVEDSKEVAK